MTVDLYFFIKADKFTLWSRLQSSREIQAYFICKIFGIVFKIMFSAIHKGYL